MQNPGVSHRGRSRVGIRETFLRQSLTKSFIRFLNGCDISEGGKLLKEKDASQAFACSSLTVAIPRRRAQSLMFEQMSPSKLRHVLPSSGNLQSALVFVHTQRPVCRGITAREHKGRAGREAWKQPASVPLE